MSAEKKCAKVTSHDHNFSTELTQCLLLIVLWSGYPIAHNTSLLFYTNHEELLFRINSKFKIPFKSDYLFPFIVLERHCLMVSITSCYRARQQGWYPPSYIAYSYLWSAPNLFLVQRWFGTLGFAQCRCTLSTAATMLKM